MRRRVLITGGAGFIGFHLTKTLVKQGWEIDLVDNFGRGVCDAEIELLLAHDGVRLFAIDLCDRGAVVALETDYYHIYHLAAIIGVLHVMSRPYEVLRDNILMLSNVIDLARRQSNLDRLLFASTSEIYAGSVAKIGLPVPTPENSIIVLPGLDDARTSYMLSKLYGEAMCLQSGLPFSIVRPHNIYGPRMGMAHVVPELLKKAYDGSDGCELEVASVHHTRAFCYIDDAVTMIIALMATPKGRGQIVNLGNQWQEVSIGQLAEVVVKTVGRALTVRPTDVTPGSTSRRCPDMSLLTGLIGVTANTTLEEGVARTFDWYRANIFDGGGVTAR